ncbi:M23 family metallopeptidase [Leifsonia sp. A12D58]|uniref:M23 family metallopeptidase n=1 Tax=Leifsonia sp. A12D58 TaxID=3397674 RepID=UPI0039E19B1D
MQVPVVTTATADSAQPLTRREIRERERLAQLSAPVAAVEVAAEVVEAPVEDEPTAAPAAPVATATVAAVTPVTPVAPVVEVPAAVAPIDLISPATALAADLPTVTVQTVVIPVVHPSDGADGVDTDGVPTTTTSTEIPLLFATSRREQREQASAKASTPKVRLTAGAFKRSDAKASAHTSHTISDAERPTPDWRPSTSADNAARSRRTAPAAITSGAPTGRMRKFAAKGVTIAAMGFVALMAVSTSLPAEALLSSADVQAAALSAKKSSNTEETQSLTFNAAGLTADGISVERDGFDSKSIAEVAAASGIRLEASFTNNPNGTVQWPFSVGVHIGDEFGHRDCAGCSSNHQGQDFNPGLGAPIQSIADGVVSYTEDGDSSLGVHIMVDHVINGEIVTSVYAHMIHGSIRYKVGDLIKVGDIVGLTGTTGMSTGPHLHFEIRLGGRNGVHVDPLAWLYANTN